jgi:predicted PurR-regulated permease PerM
VLLGIGVAMGGFLVYYVLVDWAGLTRWVGSHLGIEPGLGAVIVGDAAVSVRRYFWSLTISAVVTAVLIGGTAWLLGVPLAFTIAVVTLVTSYVPYVGAIVSGAFATIIALGSNGIEAAVVMLVVILVVQNIVQTIVLVKLAGTALSLHPIVVLGATIIGAAVAGMLGAALASPAVAVAILVRRRLAQR